MNRHFDHVIDVNVVLSVDKLRQKIEANVHVRGKDIHAEAIEPDMYAAIDALADKLDRQVLKHKEKLSRPPRRDRESDRRRSRSAAAGRRHEPWPAYNLPARTGGRSATDAASSSDAASAPPR